MLQKVMSLFRKRPKTAVQLQDRGFVKVVGASSREIRWSEIDEVLGYKWDAITRDMIVIRFTLVGDVDWVEVTDEEDGFSDLMDALVQKLPAMAADWFERLGQPPFAENRTILFKRGQA